MSRRVDPSNQYRMRIHRTHGYQYASTQCPVMDSDNTRKQYRHKHWGRIDERNRFHPNQEFLLLPVAEREKMIFPPEWDLSELESLLSHRSPGRPAYRGADENRFYGDVWLLEQIAEKTGLTKDLEKVFAGNREMVHDILTLAMFPYLTGKAYNHVEAWQELGRFPSCHRLSPGAITRITQAITEQNRMDLVRLRHKRMKKGGLCAVDSTSRSAYGSSLRDVTWGKNKERLPLPQTVEVVVCSLSSHLPLYYRSFPGNMPDVRSLETILKDLHDADFRDYVLLTDRGYESLRNMKMCIQGAQAFISASKVQLKRTRKRIASMGEFSTHPPDMVWNAAKEVYEVQYKEELSISGSCSTDGPLYLNLYFDPVLRAKAQVHLANAMAAEASQLQTLKDEGTTITEDMLSVFDYFDVTLAADSSTVASWAVKPEEVRKEEQTEGFFALMTYGLEITASEALRLYGLRDEQEKYFTDMKTALCADTQQNWSEKGKIGRLFILFVGLILVSHLKYIWKTTELKELFSYSFGIIEEMRRIRCIEHTGRSKFITPFIGKQIKICDAFGFEIPKGCSPSSRKYS